MNEYYQDYENSLEEFKVKVGSAKMVNEMEIIFQLSKLIRSRYELEFSRLSDATEFQVFLKIATTIYYETKK